MAPGERADKRRVLAGHNARSNKEQTMIKPSDIPSKPTLDTDRMAGIEKDFDNAIRAAAAAGNWPALVNEVSDQASEAEVEAVAERYRAERWIVATGIRPYRAMIHQPRGEHARQDPLLESLRAWAAGAGNMELSHLITAAINGEEWAHDRVIEALTAIDTTRPDNATAHGGGAPV